MEMLRGIEQEGKGLPYMEMSRDNGQKRFVFKYRIAAPKSFFIFHSEN